MQYSKSILDTIGKTPLVKLNKVVSEIPALVLAKVESFNPGNSIKDRMALKMIENAEKNGNFYDFSATKKSLFFLLVTCYVNPLGLVNLRAPTSAPRAGRHNVINRAAA